MARGIPDSLQELLYEEASFQCAYCGYREGLNLTVHHITPQNEGGPTDYSNLIVLCHNCHHKVDETRTIDRKDIRRIKRFLVGRLFTPMGASAARLAYSHPAKRVGSFPAALQHLVDLGFFQEDDTFAPFGWIADPNSNSLPDVTGLAVYSLTEAGSALTRQWLLRTSDLPDTDSDPALRSGHRVLSS